MKHEEKAMTESSNMPVYYPTRKQVEDAEMRPRLLLPIVLDEANRIRLALAIGEGLLPELPQGVPGNGELCVLARALSNGWDASVDDDEVCLTHPFKLEEDFRRAAKALEDLGFEDVEYGTGFVNFLPSWSMGRFIRNFDGGIFPELILGDD